jgi:hypothetical protein
LVATVDNEYAGYVTVCWPHATRIRSASRGAASGRVGRTRQLGM